MKKLLVNICVVILIVVSVFALTACGLFGAKNTNETPNDNIQIETPDAEDNSQTKTPNTNLGDGNGEIAPAIIATYNYDIVYAEYLLLPNLHDLLQITEEELAELLPDVQTLQMYLNEIDAEYSNAKMEFCDDFTMQLIFSDGTKQEYYYAIEDDYLYIGNYVETNDGLTFYYDFQGVLDDEYIQFEMPLDDYGLVVVYMQFVVVV